MTMTTTERRMAKTLIAVQIVTLLLALGAGIAATISFAKEQHSRQNARYDTCVLIKGLADAASVGSRKQRIAERAYIAQTPLSNCNTYANTDK